MIELITDGDGTLIPVKVVPGASRTRYLGEWEGRARIAVAAPPEKGKANAALITVVAELLGVKKRDVSIVSGETSPIKVLRVSGVKIAAIRKAFSPNRE